MSDAAGGHWRLTSPEPIETHRGAFAFHAAVDAAGAEVAWALTRGDVTEAAPLLMRVHSSCVTSETFGGCDCDCAEQLGVALERIAERGRGVLFYLFQEGRGAGFLAKARDRMLVQASEHRLTTFDAYAQMGLRADARRYDVVPALCEALGIGAPIELLTNNPEKLAALEGAGLRIVSSQRLSPSVSPFNHHYVSAKRRSGHRLAHPETVDGAAALPEAVAAVDVAPLAGAPHLERHARYLLPVDRDGAAGPVWLWLHAYRDSNAGDDRVVFTLGDPRRPGAPALFQEQPLRERLPLRRAPARAAWRTGLARLVEAGAGAAVFLPPGVARDAPDAASRALLAHHCGAADPA